MGTRVCQDLLESRVSLVSLATVQMARTESAAHQVRPGSTDALGPLDLQACLDSAKQPLASVHQPMLPPPLQKLELSKDEQTDLTPSPEGGLFNKQTKMQFYTFLKKI